MRVYIKSSENDSLWVEMPNTREVSISLENGGQFDLFDTDAETLRVTMKKAACSLQVDNR